MSFEAVVEASFKITGRGTAIVLRSYEGVVRDGDRLVFRSAVGTFREAVKSVEHVRALGGGEKLGLVVVGLDPSQIPEGTEITSDPGS